MRNYKLIFATLFMNFIFFSFAGITSAQNTSQQNYCPNLKYYQGIGSRNSRNVGETSKLQKFLKQNLNLTNQQFLVTGYFGNVTKEFVKQFQENNNLVISGVVGAPTRLKIAQACSQQIQTQPTIQTQNTQNVQTTNSNNNTTNSQTQINLIPVISNSSAGGDSLNQIATPNSTNVIQQNTSSNTISNTATASNTQSSTSQTGKNPYYDINPQIIFPNKNTILSNGISYSDIIPDTLDLSTRAEWFLKGATLTQVPYSKTPNTFIPTSPAIFHGKDPVDGQDKICDGKPPCLETADGTANWGKLELAMFDARAMTGYDRDDRFGVLNRQYQSLKDMLNYDLTYQLLLDAKPGIVFPNQAITPNTVAMEALVKRYEQDPSNFELKKAIQEFVKMHKDKLVTLQQNGQTYSYYYDSPNSSPDTFLGYMGDYYTPFINGRASLAMFDWYKISGDQNALDIGTKLNEFLRSYNGGIFKTNGEFSGQIHSYLQAAHALLAEAEVRLKSNPNDAIAKDNILKVQKMYDYIKNKTGASVIGNFGEIGTTGDMIRVGMKLSELNSSLNYEEIERWTRNQLAEGQIDSYASQYIPNINSSDARFNNIGSKVVGMFFSDASHSLSIPYNRNARYNLDGPSNAMRAMYEVWSKIIEVKGNFAQINFNLNRASKYIDIKSSLPYSGQIDVITKDNLGPVRQFGLRIPTWIDRDRLIIVKINKTTNLPEALKENTDWVWMSVPYINVKNIEANYTYRIQFPIKIQTINFSDLRSSDQWWYEGISANGQNNWNLITYRGKFRGDTLVSVPNMPTVGILRYQRQNLNSLPDTNVEPPQKSIERFVAD